MYSMSFQYSLSFKSIDNNLRMRNFGVFLKKNPCKIYSFLPKNVQNCNRKSPQKKAARTHTACKFQVQLEIAKTNFQKTPFVPLWSTVQCADIFIITFPSGIQCFVCNIEVFSTATSRHPYSLKENPFDFLMVNRGMYLNNSINIQIFMVPTLLCTL